MSWPAARAPEIDQATEGETTSPEASFARRRARDRALVLPLVGLLLLLPPIATLFEVDARLFGVPVAFLYVFGVWALLIIAAMRLSRSLGAMLDDGPVDDAGSGTVSTVDGDHEAPP